MPSPETSQQIKPTAQPAKVVIIGFGSPIRGDDAFGPLVADRLEEEIDLPQVTVLSRHILTAEMVEILQDATYVIFVDAATDGPVGGVLDRPLTPKRDVQDAIAHSVDARGLLAWTEALYGSSPPAILVSTRAVTFEYANYELSPAVQAIVRPVMDHICQLVQRHLDSQPVA